MWGSWGIAPLSLNLVTRWRWVVSFMPWPLYSWGKCPQYPLNRKLCGHVGKERNLAAAGPSNPQPNHCSDWATPARVPNQNYQTGMQTEHTRTSTHICTCIMHCRQQTDLKSRKTAVTFLGGYFVDELVTKSHKSVPIGFAMCVCVTTSIA
jgi:hypothetical protein